MSDTVTCGALCVADSLGELTINGVSMHTPAWNVLTVAQLWFPPKNRGENIVITGLPGRVAYPMEVEQTDLILPMVVSGRYDKDGNLDSDGIFARLRKNLQYLRTNVYGPVDGTTATWTATLQTPWGDDYTAEVQVLDIAEVSHVVELASSNLTLRIPAGEFALIP